MTVTITDRQIIVVAEGEVSDEEWDQAMDNHGIWHEAATLINYGITEEDTHVWTFTRG